MKECRLWIPPLDDRVWSEHLEPLPPYDHIRTMVMEQAMNRALHKAGFFRCAIAKAEGEK